MSNIGGVRLGSPGKLAYLHTIRMETCYESKEVCAQFAITHHRQFDA